METRFLHHAQAIGVAGRIIRPLQEVFSTKPTSALPQAGGYSSSQAGPFRYEQIFSYEAAYTDVSGSFDSKDGAHYTRATAVVEGLRILNVITADRITARVATRHTKPGEEPDIQPFGSSFEGLRIAGSLVDVDLAVDVFSEFATASSLRRAYAGDQRLKPHLGPDGKPPESKGVTLTSLVRGMRGLPAAVKSAGGMIELPSVGRLYLGDIVITDQARRLTMLRLEFGSPDDGWISVDEVEGNGRFWP